MTEIGNFGIFYDLTGKGNYKLCNKFPTFLEYLVASEYLRKYVNITGIENFIVMEINKAWHDASNVR